VTSRVHTVGDGARAQAQRSERSPIQLVSQVQGFGHGHRIYLARKLSATPAAIPARAATMAITTQIRELSGSPSEGTMAGVVLKRSVGA
jgi:hypothetical protein